MRPGLCDQLVIVTGGGHNLGRAVAEACAAAGARVVLASRNAGRLESAAAGIRAAGGEAIAVPTDVTDASQVEALVARAEAWGGPVDVAVAFAGGGAPMAAPDELEPAAFDEVVRVNLHGTFHLVRAVLPSMRARDRGRILTCAGGGAFWPVMGTPLLAYACAKAAVCRLTDQLTAELWETSIRVNAIEPGPVGTAEVSPQQVAELAVWLASEESAPLRGRLVATTDAWWRDRAQVEAVDATVHAYRLRRADP
ncbi:MAG: SDR family NAD(P)-dependent oxidoreductase [Planctomycetota bacterium]|nr:SDR family NAD(P)-dependent oxidoreductase [Planctomycetota bacterium]MDA0934248.1 SDR family NAD(P)-dependent oxidoreductase [Planctomycetota bacterium]